MRRIFLISLLLIAFSSVALAHTVEFKLTFAIQDTTDTIHVNGSDFAETSGSWTSLAKPYISANRSVVAALISGGPFLKMEFSKQAANYTFSLKQEEGSMMLAFTNGTWKNIENKASGKIISSQFGSLQKTAPDINNWPLYMQLHYPSIDINGVGTVSGSIAVTNLGINALGLPIVKIELS